MGIFNLFRKSNKVEKKLYSTADEVDDIIGHAGNNFEFLIKGDIDISNENFDQIMSPVSFNCKKLARDSWTYYQIGNDEFSYSFEPPGFR